MKSKKILLLIIILIFTNIFRGDISTVEPYNNTVTFQKIDGDIISGMTTTYLFTDYDIPVYVIEIKGTRDIEDVPVIVESLKSTSTFINQSAPGIVYRNINIWADTNDLNYTYAEIKFSVKNDWINTSKVDIINLFHYDGDKWVSLNTTTISKDKTYTHFKSITNNLSIFAISGIKSNNINSTTNNNINIIDITQPKPKVIVVTTTYPIEKINNNKKINNAEKIDNITRVEKRIPGFGIIIIMIAILLNIIRRRK